MARPGGHLPSRFPGTRRDRSRNGGNSSDGWLDCRTLGEYSNPVRISELDPDRVTPLTTAAISTTVGPDYLVMEYVDGKPLKGPLPLDQALKYAVQICEPLAAAQRRP